MKFRWQKTTRDVGKSPVCAAVQIALLKTKLNVEIVGIADKSESWPYCSSHLPNSIFICPHSIQMAQSSMVIFPQQ